MEGLGPGATLGGCWGCWKILAGDWVICRGNLAARARRGHAEARTGPDGDFSLGRGNLPAVHHRADSEAQTGHFGGGLSHSATSLLIVSM